MNLEDITPLILTWNEEPNIIRTLERLRWAREVIVLDSYSTDETVRIASSFSNVRVEQVVFVNHSAKWNHGIALTQTPWVLALDADYVLSAGFEDELAALDVTVPAYEACFRYLVYGSPLRASLYPPRAVLFDKNHCHYVQDGHTQQLDFSGPVGHLHSRIDHDDRKPLARWVVSQDKCALLEAEKLAAADPTKLRLQDKLRLTCWAAVPASLVFTLLVRGTLLDGWRGWFYALQRVLAEIMLALRLIERRFNHDK